MWGIFLTGVLAIGVNWLLEFVIGLNGELLIMFKLLFGWGKLLDTGRDGRWCNGAGGIRASGKLSSLLEDPIRLTDEKLFVLGTGGNGCSTRVTSVDGSDSLIPGLLLCDSLESEFILFIPEPLVTLLSLGFPKLITKKYKNNELKLINNYFLQCQQSFDNW